ncbi:MAG: hypothetical protein GC149_09770 [Gammaproteobacteria bacterium]|nr:hypothetical protein [Gammaproteobacteria bacterium]
MRKHLLQSAVIGVGILGLAATAQADLTANAGVTTNYVFRGVTQTDDNPAIQGGIDYTHPSGFYAGAWGSNVKFPNAGGSALEYDLYAGFNFEVAQDVKLDVGYITYNYTDSTVNDNFSNDEVFIGAKYQNFAAYYYNGNAKLSAYDHQYFDLRYTLALPQDIKASLHYGHLDNNNAPDADDIGIRFSKDIASFNTSIAFTRVDPNSGDSQNELFLTVTKEFDLMK